jgi:hypothetical protein
MSRLAEIVDRAQRLPPEQRVHVLGALLDAARARGEPWSPRWRDFWGAVRVRFSGTLPAERESLLLPRWSGVLEVVLVAPVVIAPQWARLIPAMPPSALLAVAPLIKRTTVSFLDGPWRDELAHLFEKVDDGAFDRVEPEVAAWWPREDTEELLHELRAEVDAFHGSLADPIEELLRGLYVQQQQTQQQQSYPPPESPRDTIVDVDGRIGVDAFDGEDTGAGAEPREYYAVDPRSGRESQPGHRVSIGIDGSDHGELAPETRYWLWIEIAREAVLGALATGPALPALPGEAELDVVIFGFDGQLRIDPERRHGVLRIVDEGPAHVVRAAGERPDDDDPYKLWFSVDTPADTGPVAVRVNVYHRGLLLQSHRIVATVVRRIGDTVQFEHDVDYALTQQFDLAALEQLAPTSTSILLNDDGRGTHGFRFFGADGFVEDTTINAVRLAKLLDYARGALREVAWGSREPFLAGTDTYRYMATTAAQLGDDLIRLARSGYRLWGDALAELGVRGAKVRALRDRMRLPAPLQLALKQSAAHVFPAALVYDHPLDSTSKSLVLCPRFEAALEAGEDLATVECFRGLCPSYGADDVVCPSGFWGFRHELGVPLHLGKRGEVATAVARGAKTRMVAGYSTDPSFTAFPGHLERLKMLKDVTVAPLAERDACLNAMKAGEAEIAYFYCHGGITAAGTPYLEVGAPDSQPITADNLIGNVWWDPLRPLVVLNGCHTTAATPEEMFGLVEGFVVHANAAGVIGTEITIFEPIATRFGEELLRRFVAGESIGAAVRASRLALLAEGNPLGLVYIPFALASLRLEA